MKGYIKSFEMFENDNQQHNDLEHFRKMEKWIESFWETIDSKSDEEIAKIFDEIENTYGEDTAKVIDNMYSADKLHYLQSGKPSLSGAVDPREFIENFDTISKEIDELLNIADSTQESALGTRSS